jgi:hypothetical protein
MTGALTLRGDYMSTIVRDMPNTNLNADGDMQEAVKRLKGFFEQLGWNEGSQIIDPCKIKISRKDYDRLADELMSNASNPDDKASLGFLWINYSPSVGDDVEEGKVKLLDGYLTPYGGVH